MKIIRADRGQGKTTKLVKMSNKEWKEEHLKHVPEFYRQFAVELDEEKEY